MAGQFKPPDQQVVVITGAASGMSAIHADRQQQDIVAQSPQDSLFHPGMIGNVYGPGKGVQLQ